MKNVVKYDPHIHHRRSIRYKGYDYSQQGGYFVTICVHDHECLLGDVSDTEMQLNDCGSIAHDAWIDLPNHYPNVEMDEFVVMPNHVHGIIIIMDHDETFAGAGSEPAPTMVKRYPLSEIVRSFKTFSARRINELRGTHGCPVWQRNYYEHIIRNEKELIAIRGYIVNNPSKWSADGDKHDYI